MTLPGSSDGLLLEDARPAGADQQPTMMRATPARTPPRNRAMIPAITRIAARTHNNVAVAPVIAKSANMFVPPSGSALPSSRYPRGLAPKRDGFDASDIGNR